MARLRRSNDRCHDQIRDQDVWSTFCRQGPESLPGSFGPLEEILEIRLGPGAVLRSKPQDNGEKVTYLRQGSLSWSDSTGRSGVISAGEFQRITNGRGIQYNVTNASSTLPAQLFRVRFCALVAGALPSGIPPCLPSGPLSGPEHNRFFTAERRRSLCTVASPDGRRGSLHLQLDAVMYSTLLFNGQHVVYELPAGRNAWLQIVQGKVTVHDMVLSTGDGIGMSAVPSVSLTAREETEVLLFDVGVPVPPKPGG